MMRPIRFTLLFAALLAATVSLGAPVRADELSEAFEKHLTRVREQIKDGRPGSAKRSLAAMLKEHEDADYVRARRSELADLALRIAFAEAHPTPKASEFVSGDLISWDGESGEIRIEYTPKTADDLLKRRGGFTVFPAPFTGPFEVRVRGSSYPRTGDAGPAAYIGPDEDEDGVEHMTRIYFGLQPWTANNYEYSVPSRIIQVEGEDEDVVEEDGREIAPARAGRSYKLDVRVRRTSVEAKAAGKSIGKVKKPKGVFGYFTLHMTGWSHLELKGPIEPSWIQSRIDKAQEAARTTFAESFDPEEHLPAWVFEAADVALGTRTMNMVPSGTSSEHVGLFAQALASMIGSKTRRVEEVIKTLEGEDGNPGLAAYLEGLVCLARYDLKAGRTAVQSCLEHAPGYGRAELLLGILETLAGDRAGRERLKKVRTTYRGEDDAYYLPTWLLMFDGRVKQARTVSGLASQHGLGGDAKKTLDRALVMAENGPAWERTYSYTSKNYEVFSDIGDDACKETARELERMFRLYQSTVANVRSDRTRKFKVYLFSGQAGFMGYMGRLRYFWGPSTGGAAGVYSPLLKQLLIWNLPTRDSMMETVRHEGFHQFLDRFIPEAPTWFNEGMACYYEVTTSKDGRLQVGDPHTQNLRVIEELDMLEIEDFFALPSAKFYEGGHKSYAQAWAIVHFLRHSNSTWRQRYNDFVKRLGEVSGEQAMKEIFPESLWFDLRRGVEAHIRELRDA